jgi:hypothetical protein
LNRLGVQSSRSWQHEKPVNKKKGRAMATKQLREQRIQNVAAPLAEPGAASLIIPRRGLLTGAALVLAGSASGCCGGSGAGAGNQKPLRTQFMADFTDAFIGPSTKIKDPAPPPGTDPWPDPPNATDPPTRLWPKSTQHKPDIVTDYLTFADVLMTVGYRLQTPPTFSPGTLAAQISDFLKAKDWPAAPPVPTEYQGELPTVHLVEIGVILDRLLQAMNSFTEGNPTGSGSNWPPH